jgi:DNA-3-methyladenine glycosylase II
VLVLPARPDVPSFLDEAYRELAARDQVLRAITEMRGRPNPFVWKGGAPPGSSNFAAMLLHIVSQQISTAVALVLFGRIERATGGSPDPQAIAALGPERLRELGLSHAKAGYLVDLAKMHMTGSLDTERLDGLDDDQAIAALTSARGVGLWTAQMFLIHQLHRPDVLPAGDLGIRSAVQAAWKRSTLPSIDAVTRLGANWAPFRTYAAALLWAARTSG